MGVFDPEPFDVVVPLSPDQVAEQLRAQTSQVPFSSMVPGRFWAAIEGDEIMLRKRSGKNNLRPVLTARMEAVPGGTRIHGHVQLPTYARAVGRFASVLPLVLGAGFAGVALSQGQAALGATEFWMFLAMAGVMPLVAWMLPGRLVSKAQDEKPELIERLHVLLQATPPEPVQDATRDVDPAEGDADKKRRGGQAQGQRQ